MSKTFTYTALRVTQQPESPPMYVLGLDAAGLLEWADVPNAKADYMAGYQRVYSQERAAEITEFLSGDVNNIIPGAVIVAVDEEKFSIEDRGDGLVSITIDGQSAGFSDRLTEIRGKFEARLSQAELDSVGVPDPAEGEAADGEEEDSGGEDGPMPDSYLAALTAELRLAVEDFESLSKPRQHAITNYVESAAKPGLIIDGQHRVYGAKNVSSHDVMLPVVLLPGLRPAEQVFHFYVLNNKAKPLSSMELRRTVSTSLTNAEIESLWARFENAGVNPRAARWTHKMNNDPGSPFKGLIDFGLGGGGFIKENVAYQLVTKFVGMGRRYKPLIADIAAFSNASDERLTYFYAFWSAIRSQYKDVWDAGVAAQGNPLAQIFYKAAMLVLQEFILDQLVQLMNVRRMEKKPSPFADLEDLDVVVKAYLQDLPAEFFVKEWQEKQLDTTERRAFLKTQIQEVIENQGKNLGNRRLFRKQG